jgi:heat shock protein HtpX
MSRRSAKSKFGRDGGLQARMLVTMFLLGLVYAVLVGVLLTVGLGALTILVIAVALLSMQFFTSDKIALATIGAKEVTPAQAPELHGLVDRLCVQANIPKPRLAIVDMPMPNAFAIGRSQKAATVCATSGLMELLSPAELEGVIGHELTHIINRDVMVMTLASFFASLAAMIMQFGFFFGGGFGGGGGDSQGESDIELVILVAAVVKKMTEAPE